MTDMGLFECLDRTYMAQIIFDKVFEHDALKDHPDLLKLADVAAEALAELYQAIGAAMPDEEPKAAE